MIQYYTETKYVESVRKKKSYPLVISEIVFRSKVLTQKVAINN